MKKILLFYADSCNLEKFLEIVGGAKKGKKISLRLIDWFVTNYAKKHNVVYPITRPTGEVEYFSPYQRYRDQLSSYPKKLFDPFCRGNVFRFKINRNEDGSDSDAESPSVETAICQLHFFKWAIENLILDYIEPHADEIYQDMQTNGSRINTNLIKKTKQQLSQSVHQKMVCSETNVKIPFYKK
jgi:hypothetical protein